VNSTSLAFHFPLHREILALLVVLAAAAWSFEAAAEEQSAKSLQIRVQGLPGEVSMAPHAVAERLVLKRFAELHPNIQVLPAEGLQINSLNREAVTIMMIAGGLAPDVILMTLTSYDTYVQQGLLAPMDDLIAKDPMGDLIMDRIKPQIRPAIKKTGPDGESHIFALPIKFLVNGIYFNRPLFRAAGLPQRGPKDWEELRQFAAAIEKLGEGYHGMFVLGGSLAGMNIINFLWAAGADPIHEVAPNDWRAAFDSPEAVTAYMYYYQLCEIDRVVLRQPSWPTPQELLRVGMFFQNVGDTRGPRLDPNIWGFGAAPAGPTGKRVGAIDAELLGVYSQIKDEWVQRAAWEYIRFVTSEEADRMRISSMVENGQASLVNPAALRKFGFSEYLALAPLGLEEQFNAALDSGKPVPYGRNCNLIYAEMSYPIDRMLLDSNVRESWHQGDMDAVRTRISDILSTAAQQTNLRMLGYVPPQQMANRRIVASVVLLCIVVAFSYVGWRISRLFLATARSSSRPVTGNSIVPWLCLFPAMALVLIWNYIPLLRGTQLAFLDYKIVLPSVFVGLDNFANVLFYHPFWKSLLATLIYAALTLTFGFFAPILLAYSLHLLPRYRLLYRTIFYLPAVISGTAVFFLWRELFSVNGIFNAMLNMIGIHTSRAWTEDPYLAMISCVLPTIWAGAGPGCLIYLAALKTIPPEQFEASEIDGAGFFSKTRHIVLPSLKALIIINFIGAVSAAFHGASNILIMTGGGPNGLTEVSSLLIFFEAFTRLRFGPATAMAWIIGSMLVGFTVIQLQYLSRVEFKTAK